MTGAGRSRGTRSRVPEGDGPADAGRPGRREPTHVEHLAVGAEHDAERRRVAGRRGQLAGLVGGTTTATRYGRARSIGRFAAHALGRPGRPGRRPAPARRPAATEGSPSRAARRLAVDVRLQGGGHERAGLGGEASRRAGSGRRRSGTGAARRPVPAPGRRRGRARRRRRPVPPTGGPATPNASASSASACSTRTVSSRAARSGWRRAQPASAARCCGPSRPARAAGSAAGSRRSPAPGPLPGPHVRVGVPVRAAAQPAADSAPSPAHVPRRWNSSSATADKACTAFNTRSPSTTNATTLSFPNASTSIPAINGQDTANTLRHDTNTSKPAVLEPAENRIVRQWKIRLLGRTTKRPANCARSLPSFFSRLVISLLDKAHRLSGAAAAINGFGDTEESSGGNAERRRAISNNFHPSASSGFVSEAATTDVHAPGAAGDGGRPAPLRGRRQPSTRR